MEPGHEDREYAVVGLIDLGGGRPQWSPVMKTGNTPPPTPTFRCRGAPQWSPVMKTGNTGPVRRGRGRGLGASMEPGHEDREYPRLPNHHEHDRHASMEPGHEDREYLIRFRGGEQVVPPQWSPVMKTGNTLRRSLHPIPHRHASMEPGHEDREYMCGGCGRAARPARLNGARS